MVWLPSILFMKPLGTQYDYILVDECQDLSTAQRELILKCRKINTRMFMFGDKDQTIYTFMSSDFYSFEKLKNLPNTICMPLSISYRCPKNIVDFAKKIVPTIEHNENNPIEGLVIDNVDIDVELGGGIRDLSHIKTLLDIGVKRVIIGSAALNLDFVKQAIDNFGSEKIVIGIDCKNMMVATHGWLNVSDISAIEFANKLKEIGVKTIIFTDIAKDGTLEGINANQTKRMVDETGLDIVASGGAKTLDDIKIAKEIGCEGIILGKSIYSGAINLEEAIKRFED